MCTLSEICTEKVLFPGDCGIDQMHKIFQVMGTPTEDDGKESLPFPIIVQIFQCGKNEHCIHRLHNQRRVSNIINTG